MESFIHYILENSLFEQILTSLEIASLGVARQTVALGQPCFLVLFPLAIFVPLKYLILKYQVWRVQFRILQQTEGSQGSHAVHVFPEDTRLSNSAELAACTARHRWFFSCCPSVPPVLLARMSVLESGFLTNVVHGQASGRGRLLFSSHMKSVA